MNKFSIITGFLGGIKNRYMVYQDNRTFKEKLEIASKIKGLSALEICYPADVIESDDLKTMLYKKRLGVSAVNFRSRRTGKWLRGSFSSALQNERQEVVKDLKKAMDLAEILGCNRVTTCPLNEGHDYPFELDYIKAYDFFADSIAQAASHNPNIKISIEYKWNDPRARCLLGNAGETLAMCESIGYDNVGVTLDFGHSIQSHETPAQTVAMLNRANRLFYVHINDNDKYWDWDMIPGAYNFFDFIEFFYYLRKVNYDDYFGFDVYPKEINTKDTYETAFSLTQKMIEISKRIDDDLVRDLVKERNPAITMKRLINNLLY